MPEETKPAAEEEIKVTDRRTFTPSGERRAPDQPKVDFRREKLASGIAEESARDRDPSAIGFENFVRYLAQVALHQMTGERNPATGAVEINLDEARQTIDILVMLKEKTKGNLSAAEERTLEDLLVHLKIEFSRRATAERR